MAEKRVSVWVQAFKDRAHLVLQWIDPDTGKRKSRSAGTADPREAEAKRVDLESDLNNGRYQEASRMTWARFRELFEEEYLSGLRPGSRLAYAQAFDRFERLCHPGQLRSVTERTLSTLVAAMRREKTTGPGGHAPTTIRNTLTLRSKALRWAARQKFLPAAPDFPQVKVPRKNPRPVPVEAFERLLEKAPDQETRVYLLCGWLAGLRLAEAYELEWEQAEQAPYIDLARDRIVLPAEFVKSAEDQWVPLDSELRKVLLALPRHGRKVFRFIDPRDGHVITAHSVSQRVIRLARRAGVKLTMHTLRKGFGCRYAGKVPAQVLQKLMRHADIKITMDFYANVDDAVMEAVLGTQRNSSRNSAGRGGVEAPLPTDASPDVGKDL